MNCITEHIKQNEECDDYSLFCKNNITSKSI